MEDFILYQSVLSRVSSIVVDLELSTWMIPKNVLDMEEKSNLDDAKMETNGHKN